ncbi:Uncharacterised protein [Achromobacter sp. 2789STDY5608621]|nr:Uncharacterised protein [Achromobacter sp. 2789STDY5608621]
MPAWREQERGLEWSGRAAGYVFKENAMSDLLYLHVPPKPDPIPPGSPPGDLPVDPDTDEPEVDLPPLEPPSPRGKRTTLH